MTDDERPRRGPEPPGPIPPAPPFDTDPGIRYPVDRGTWRPYVEPPGTYHSAGPLCEFAFVVIAVALALLFVLAVSPYIPGILRYLAGLVA